MFLIATTSAWISSAYLQLASNHMKLVSFTEKALSDSFVYALKQLKTRRQSASSTGTSMRQFYNFISFLSTAASRILDMIIFSDKE